jgi:hypothetical protein
VKRTENMKMIEVHLSEEVYKKLDEQFPRSSKSAAVGKRALRIVKEHFLSLDPNAQFVRPRAGADLRVVTEDQDHEIEVKGTDDADISWQKLKVSSQQSYDLLAAGMPLYRVCGVYSHEPRIHVMSFGEDFDMVPEARWRLRPQRQA